MNKFNWMPIGKVGSWTDKNKQQVNIDEKYLDEVVAATNPADVKFVIEHPKYNKIGFGKVGSLKRVGEFLFALPKEVNADFKEAVNKGDLPNRSMTIHKATKKLLDISFLPPEIDPAIEGLGSYAFSKAADNEDLEVFILQEPLPGNESHFAGLDDNKIEFASMLPQLEVSSYPFRSVKDLFRNIKDFFIEKFGKDTADKILPNYTIDDTGTPPVIWSKQSSPYINNAFSKNNNEDKMDLSKIDLSKVDANIKAAIEALQGENNVLKTDLEKSNFELQSAKSVITKAEQEKIEAEVNQFCSTEKIAKKILPADHKKAVLFLMAQKEKSVLEFSKDDGQKEKFDAYEFAKSLIEKLPDIIETEEFASGKIAAGQDILTDAQKTGKQIAEFVKR